MGTFRRCNSCHKLFEGRACKACALKYDKKRKEKVEALQVYSKSRWQKCRRDARLKYMDYDIWALGVGVLVKLDKVIVHHIVERDEDPSLIYDLDNLITVSEASHGEIHQAYISNKAEALKRIEDGLNEFRRLFGNDS